MQFLFLSVSILFIKYYLIGVEGNVNIVADGMQWEKRVPNCVDKKAKKIKEELKTRDGKGNVIRSREVLVDATTYFYETHRKCKYCGFEDVLKSSETKKN